MVANLQTTFLVHVPKKKFCIRSLIPQMVVPICSTDNSHRPCHLLMSYQCSSGARWPDPVPINFLHDVMNGPSVISHHHWRLNGHYIHEHIWNTDADSDMLVCVLRVLCKSSRMTSSWFGGRFAVLVHIAIAIIQFDRTAERIHCNTSVCIYKCVRCVT